MDAGVLDPQMRAALQRNDEIVRALGAPPAGPDGARQFALQARAWWNEGGPGVARIHDTAVPGPHRDIPVRLYVPRDSGGPLPAFIYFHGGGWRTGSPASNDRQLRELAHAWGGIVLSADYAHLPEQRFPVPVEEAAAVYRWALEQGVRWGVDGRRLAFGGTSAGANVALGAFHAAGAPAALRCGACFVGVFDDDVDTASMRDVGDAFVPGRQAARAMFADYLGDARRDARFDTRAADAASWPPLFLAAAEHDVFRDGALAFADRARQAGRAVELKVYPGVTHLFFGYSRLVDRAAECIRDAAAFLGAHLPPQET